jgi:hypothetical protein
MPKRELHDIQGLVFFGYGALKQARYLFCDSMTPQGHARGWARSPPR